MAVKRTDVLIAHKHDAILKRKKQKSNSNFFLKKRKLFQVHVTSIKRCEEGRKGLIFTLLRETKTQGREGTTQGLHAWFGAELKQRVLTQCLRRLPGYPAGTVKHFPGFSASHP